MAQGRSTKIISMIKWIRPVGCQSRTLSLKHATCREAVEKDGPQNAFLMSGLDGSGAVHTVLPQQASGGRVNPGDPYIRVSGAAGLALAAGLSQTILF